VIEFQLEGVEGLDPDLPLSCFIYNVATPFMRNFWNNKTLVIYQDLLQPAKLGELWKLIFTVAHFCWYNRYKLLVSPPDLRRSEHAPMVGIRDMEALKMLWHKKLTLILKTLNEVVLLLMRMEMRWKQKYANCKM